MHHFAPQVVREALTKDYAAMAYDQPYQRALYSGGQLQEARKWHVDEYSAVIGSLSAADLQVCCCKTLIEQLASTLCWWKHHMPGRQWYPTRLPSLAAATGTSQLSKCALSAAPT